LAHVKDRIHIVRLGVKLSTAVTATAAANATKPTVAFVGRLSHYKGVDVLLNALSLTSDVNLLIAGTGPEAPRLQALAASLGLDERVAWLGHVTDDELAELYSSCLALVLPSTGVSESFGLVIPEAFSRGTPVISTDLPGVRTVNRHGITGLIVPPNDPEALASAIVRLYDSASLRLRLARGATCAAREFSVEQMVGGVEAVYSAVLRAGRETHQTHQRNA
jgi:rhamnosyl/mannosyltransferase